MIRFSAICVLLLSVLTACKTSQTITTLDNAKATLKPGSSLYVAVPERPGTDEERAYTGSDFQTVAACAKAFQSFGAVTAGRNPENLTTAIASARAANCDYLIKPEIRLWEDNPTEWNGERDLLEVDVTTVEIASGKTVSRVLLKGKSRLMTFGDKPERMLIGFFEPHATNLFNPSK